MVRPRTVCAEEVIKWPKSFKNMQQHLIDSVLMYFTVIGQNSSQCKALKLWMIYLHEAPKKGKKTLMQ